MRAEIDKDLVKCRCMNRKASDRPSDRPAQGLPSPCEYGWPTATAMNMFPANLLEGPSDESRCGSHALRGGPSSAIVAACSLRPRSRPAAAPRQSPTAPTAVREYKYAGRRRLTRWRCRASGIRGGGPSGRTCRASAHPLPHRDRLSPFNYAGADGNIRSASMSIWRG